MTAVDELDALHAYTSTTPRDPERVEPATADVYLDALYAVAYGRLGAVDRARELLSQTKEALAPVRGDAVHRAMLAVFAERVDQVCGGRGWDTASAATLATIAALGPRDRTTASRALEPMWLVAIPAKRVSTLSRVRAPDLPAAVAEAVATAGGDRLEDAFAALVGVPEAEAMTNAIAAPARIAAAPKLRRAPMAAHVLAACGRCGWGELVPELARLVIDNLDPAIPDHLDAARTAIGVLGWCDAPDALAEISRRLPRNGMRSRSELLREAADSWLGRPPSIFALVMDDARARPHYNLRGIAEAVAVARPSPDHLRDARELWPAMVDRDGRHSHVALAAVGFVDILAGAIVLSASLRPSSSAFAP